jgi:hypothetical protein
MNREQLLDQLTEDVLTYVMHGGFPEDEIAQSIKPKGLDERFEDYELLLDLHFILKEDVIEFVEDLSEHLRNVRTETETISRKRHGTVDGHINWNSTIKTRYSRNPSDNSLFVCDNRSENYDIAENIVLKRLISVIYNTLREADEYLRKEYDWVQETWRGNEDLIEDLYSIVERNVHVRRIRKPDAYEPTERMLTTAENSRQAVYRHAASLVRDRNALHEGDEDALRTLLDDTAITPDDEHRLFELFVLFRFVSTLEELRGGQFRFKTLASGRQEVARLEGDTEIVLYHDTAGDDDVSFVSEVNETVGRALSRTEKVQSEAQTVANNYFTDHNFQDHTGRPDVIVMEVIHEQSDDREYLIAEVKNSTNKDTIRRGIKETLEYLAFLRVNGDFVFGNEVEDTEDYFGSGWNGLLVIQDLEEQTASVAEQGRDEMTVLQAEELERDLEQVLENVIDSHP